jgi:hypothetical protein
MSVGEVDLTLVLMARLMDTYPLTLSPLCLLLLQCLGEHVRQNILVKATSLQITLNVDDSPLVSRSRGITRNVQSLFQETQIENTMGTSNSGTGGN